MNAENGGIGLTMNPAPCGIFACLSNLAIIVTVAKMQEPLPAETQQHSTV